MDLTDNAIRNAKPAEKPRKLFDERGACTSKLPRAEASGGASISIRR